MSAHGRVFPWRVCLGLWRNRFASAGVSTSSGSTTRLGFTSTPLPCLVNATKSPSRMRRLSKISRGMTTWRRWPMRPIGSLIAALVFPAMPSDYLIVRICQSSAAGRRSSIGGADRPGASTNDLTQSLEERQEDNGVPLRGLRFRLACLTKSVFDRLGMMRDDGQENAGGSIRLRSTLFPIPHGRGCESETLCKPGLAEAEPLTQASDIDYGRAIDLDDRDPNSGDGLAFRPGKRLLSAGDEPLAGSGVLRSHPLFRLIEHIA